MMNKLSYPIQGILTFFEVRYGKGDGPESEISVTVVEIQGLGKAGVWVTRVSQ